MRLDDEKLQTEVRADLRTDDEQRASPDSEQIERTVATPQMRNSVSVEQIQDSLLTPTIKRG